MTTEEQRPAGSSQRPSASAGMGQDTRHRLAGAPSRLPPKPDFLAFALFLISALLRILMHGNFSPGLPLGNNDAISVGSCILCGAEARLGVG